jgi:hypothetical protein
MIVTMEMQEIAMANAVCELHAVSLQTIDAAMRTVTVESMKMKIAVALVERSLKLFETYSLSFGLTRSSKIPEAKKHIQHAKYLK